MINVLIADDSPTMRKIIRAILENDPGLKVIGEAKNGQDAVNLCKELDPDIVTMDIRMPHMDGYEAIQQIMSESPRPIVVLTSTQSDREMGITFKAVEKGALMVLGKPDGWSGSDEKGKKLVAQIKAMAGVKVVGRRWIETKKRPLGLQRRPHPGETLEPVRLIAIGASTGGPPVLHLIFSHLPIDLSVPIVVVQHISPGFVQGMARWLNDTTPIQVKTAANCELLQPGVAYLAPDERHLVVDGKGRTRLLDTSPMDGHCPSVTTLFDSVAENYKSKALGVLLSGMGKDGAGGLKTMHDAGAYTIAQDEVTCVVFGMPKAAIELGAASAVLPAADIAARLMSKTCMKKSKIHV